MDALQQELSEVAIAVCRFLLQSAALDEQGYFDLADQLRLQTARLLQRVAILEEKIYRHVA